MNIPQQARYIATIIAKDVDRQDSAWAEELRMLIETALYERFNRGYALGRAANPYREDMGR